MLFSILVHFWRADYYTWSRRILQGYSHIYSDYHFRLHRARRQVRVHAEWCDKWCMIIKCIQKYDFSGDIQNSGIAPAEVNLGIAHGVWKSQKKSHSTFIYVYILSGQKFIKNAITIFKILRLNSVTREITFNRTNFNGKCQNDENCQNATFLVIFIQYESSFWKLLKMSPKVD